MYFEGLCLAALVRYDHQNYFWELLSSVSVAIHHLKALYYLEDNRFKDFFLHLLVMWFGPTHVLHSMNRFLDSLLTRLAELWLVVRLSDVFVFGAFSHTDTRQKVKTGATTAGCSQIPLCRPSFSSKRLHDHGGGAAVCFMQAVD